MLRIVRSGFSSIGKEDAKNEIKALVQAGKPALMIVPEQQTVQSELELAAALPPSAPLYFEVTNFTRLANSTFRSLGGIMGEYCDKGKKALLMWRTLTELSHTLDLTRGRREISAGIVESALRAVGEMQSLSITPELLMTALENESIKVNKRLYSKISDLARIFLLYKKLLGERYNDSGDDCEIMSAKLIENPEFLSGHSIFIDGFTSFTEPQYKLIGILARRTELTVILATSKYTEDFFEQSELRETEERLIGVARKNSADIKLIDKGGSFSDTKDSISLLISRIWRKSDIFDNITLQNAEEIRVFEASTPFEECSFVASDIKRRVMGGCSFKDFAVIARSEDAYSGILDKALSLNGIPCFSGAVKDAESYEVIKLIYSAYSAVRSGFAKEYVLTYLKCGMTGISRDDSDLFESYVETWGITGSRFTDELVWNMNPAGYDRRKTPETDSLLLRINETRKRLITPLNELMTRSADAETVREQATVLLDFLLSLNIESELRRRSELLRSVNETALAEENLGLWKLICSSLDTLVEVMGESKCTPDGFVDQLGILFSGAGMGKIPAHYDEVTIGSADQIRLVGKKHIYLIGVNDGVFPAIPSEGAYFTESDKEILCGIGLGIRPELSTKGARELYIFSRALSYGSNSVTLLYSATNARFKKTEPSEVIKRIEKLTGGAVLPIRISSLPLKDKLYSPKSALVDSETEDYGTVRAALIESGYEEEVRSRERSIDNTDIRLGERCADELFKNDIYLTQSKIDKYVNCPLSYFCSYTLGLTPEKTAEFDASGVGSLIHAILENFFKALKEKNLSPGEITPEQRAELTRKAAEKYIEELGEDSVVRSARTRIKIDRICRAAHPVVETLCDEFSVSKFTPKYFELPIKKKRSTDGGDLSPEPVSIGFCGYEKDENEKRSITVGGTIDRVDTYSEDGNVYVRVVDYKTGRKDFSVEDLEHGKNLQMFLYLRAIIDSKNEEFKKDIGLCDGGRIIPAGVVYHKTFIGEENLPIPDDSLALETVKGKQTREGMVLSDDEVLAAMGLEFTPVYDPKHPESINPKKTDRLFTEEQFNKDIAETVEGSVKRVARKMREGKICAEPNVDGDFSPCNFCDFKPICRNAKMIKKYG